MSHNPFPCTVALRIIGVMLVLLNTETSRYFLEVQVPRGEHYLKELLKCLEGGHSNTDLCCLMLKLMSPEKTNIQHG